MLRFVFIAILFLSTSYLEASSGCKKDEILKLIGVGYSKTEIAELCGKEGMSEQSTGNMSSAVEGKLVDKYSKPVSGVRIIATQSGQTIKGYEKFEGKTESDGSFRIEGLFPSFTYMLKPWSDKWTTKTAERVLSAPQGETFELPSPIVISDHDWTAAGLFHEHCVSCHGEDGVGGIPPEMAPSLVDDDWLYGGTIESIEKSITNGRRGTMLSHTDNLTPEETDELVMAIMAGDPTRTPLYKSKGCIACHYPEGKGSQVLGAANLTDNIWRFKADNQEESVRETILHGVNIPSDPKSRKAICPEFHDRLAKNDIKKLADYVANLGGQKKVEPSDLGIDKEDWTL